MGCRRSYKAFKVPTKSEQGLVLALSMMPPTGRYWGLFTLKMLI